MRRTWDAAAASDRVEHYVGDPATAASELESLFSRLGEDPRGGTCVEVGCGFGRMTAPLAERFDRVVAVDVSSRMLDLAQAAVAASNVEFVHVSGSSLEPLDAGLADVLVCYLVLQHLPSNKLISAYLREFARLLAPQGRAFVQLPVLGGGWRAHAWRLLRSLAAFCARIRPRNTAKLASLVLYMGEEIDRRERMVDAALGAVATVPGERVPGSGAASRLLARAERQEQICEPATV